MFWVGGMKRLGMEIISVCSGALFPFLFLVLLPVVAESVLVLVIIKINCELLNCE